MQTAHYGLKPFLLPPHLTAHQELKLRCLPSPLPKVLTFELKTPAPVNHTHFDVQAVSTERMGIADIEVFLPDGALIPEIAMHHVSPVKMESAKDLNARGEKAYHAGKIEESITLYLAAIEANADYAQAFSNLGLSYWKLKDYPKSVAANHYAISLGKQRGNATVVANSYYNIARTFVEKKEYKQALMNFWWANKTNPKPVYEKAIQRMNAQMSTGAE